MTKEFNLSDKRRRKHMNISKGNDGQVRAFVYFEEDVKEFIKLLKEDIYCGCGNEDCMERDRRCMEAIDKLAGSKLVKGGEDDGKNN